MSIHHEHQHIDQQLLGGVSMSGQLSTAIGEYNFNYKNVLHAFIVIEKAERIDSIR